MDTDEKKAATDAPEPKKPSELGATLGAMITDGSAIGIAAGYVVGKLIETRKLISFNALPPEPAKRDIVGMKLRFKRKKKVKSSKARKKTDDQK